MAAYKYCEYFPAYVSMTGEISCFFMKLFLFWTWSGYENVQILETQKVNLND